MTKQECLQHVKEICNGLSIADSNLSISVRNAEYQEYDSVYAVVVCHKALAKEVASGKRPSYNYTVVNITNEAIAYMKREWFETQITNAAKNVQAQYAKK